MSYDTAERRSGRLGEGSRRCPLVIGLSESNFHEFVIEKRLVERGSDGRADPGLAHFDHRLSRVSQGAQVLALKTFEFRRRGHRGSPQRPL